jgi:ferric-dicitrate binding protein FerR (iron transport regulator)
VNASEEHALELIRRRVEGEDTEVDHRELEALLLADPRLCAVYVDYLLLDGALLARGNETAGALVAGEPDDCGVDSREGGSPWLRWRPLAAAAALVLLGLAAFAGAQWGVELDVLNVSGVTTGGLSAGHTLRARHLKWESGTLEIRLRSGVSLKIEAPAECELVSPMLVRVAVGKITADVGMLGKGFVIETPQGRIVDQGTVFGVDASTAEHTDVVVFQGLVDVYSKSDGNDFTSLRSGETLRMKNHRRASRIVSSFTAGTDERESTHGSPTQNALITAVGDSMTTDDEGAMKWPSLRNPYLIVPGGMRAGALSFADEMDSWQTVPESLAGADVVRTFAVDTFNWWMQMTLTVQRPCELFVFMDVRNEVPAWLAQEFVNTGETISLHRTAHSAPQRVAYVLKYAVWKKVVLHPGEVRLGPPYPNPPPDRTTFNPTRMYGVAAKALP